MDDSNSDWDSLPHEEQGKKKKRKHIFEFNIRLLILVPKTRLKLLSVSQAAQ
jgi:hypothetical protein